MPSVRFACSTLPFVRRHWLASALLLSALCIEGLAVVQGGPPPSLALVRNPFAAIAAASVFFSYWLSHARPLTRRTIVYLTPLTWLAALAIEGRAAHPTAVGLDTLVGLGVLGALGFVLAAIRTTDPATRSRCIDQLMDALVLPLSASLTSFGLWATHDLNPVYDGRVYAFEELLGVRFSLLGVWSYKALAPLSIVATACYNLLAVAIAILAACHREQSRDREIVAAVVVAGACGFALYFVCPVAGPLTAFAPLYPGGLPPISPDAPLLTVAEGAPRNGMPSLHTIWALLLWFNAAPLPAPLRHGFRVFAALTLWAVMGLEDTHWFMDVVVGVPLAVAVQLGVIGERRHWPAACVCLAITVAWLLAFRYGLLLYDLAPAAAWLTVGATALWPLSKVSGRGGEKAGNWGWGSQEVRI